MRVKKCSCECSKILHRSDGEKKNFRMIAKLRGMQEMPKKCLCGSELNTKDILDIKDSFVLIEALEVGYDPLQQGWGYVVYDIKKQKLVESFTAVKEDRISERWKKFLDEYNDVED